MKRLFLLLAASLALVSACDDGPIPSLAPTPVPVLPPPPVAPPPPVRVPPPDPPPPAQLPYDTGSLEDRRDAAIDHTDREATRELVKAHPEVKPAAGGAKKHPPGPWRPGATPPSTAPTPSASSP